MSEHAPPGLDRNALAALLPDLRAYARLLAGAAGGADDLVQEAILRALAAAAQFQPGTSLKAWTFTILRNLFYEQARRRKREEAALRHEIPHLSRTSEPSGAGLSDLSRALFVLPPALREALVLVGAQGLTHEEAAAICRVEPGTMRARVSRARAKLAELVEPPAPRPAGA